MSQLDTLKRRRSDLQKSISACDNKIKNIKVQIKFLEEDIKKLENDKVKFQIIITNTGYSYGYVDWAYTQSANTKNHLKNYFSCSSSNSWSGIIDDYKEVISSVKKSIKSIKDSASNIKEEIEKELEKKRKTLQQAKKNLSNAQSDKRKYRWELDNVNSYIYYLESLE